jgi:hypothetical protein
VLAIGLGAAGVQRQGVVLQLETAALGHGPLTAFDLGVEEFLDPAAAQAHQMVVVAAFVELEHRFAGFEVAAHQQPGLLELHQHPVDGGQPDVRALDQQGLEHVLGRHVPALGTLEDLQDLDARQRRLQPAALQFLDLGHAPAPAGGRR